MPKTIQRLFLAVFLCWSASSALAFTHQASGFSINPPPGFTANSSSHRNHDVAVIVNSTTGKPATSNSDGTLCKIAYKIAPQNNQYSRAQINALVTTPARMKLIRNAFERIFNITHGKEFTQAGYNALEFHGTPKFGPNAADARVFISIIETSKGRASLVCATTKADFSSGLKSFRAIRQSMNVPG